jgi:hypothetical protein
MVGTVVPETVVKIVDPGTGKEVETGEVGEVRIFKLCNKRFIVNVVYRRSWAKDLKLPWAT